MKGLDKYISFKASQATLQIVAARLAVGPYVHLAKHLSVSGRENIPEGSSAVIVSNHLSYFDPPIIYLAIKKPMCFVAKKELFENPYLSTIIKLLGAIAIDREKPSLSSLKTIKKAIQSGWSLSIFIEGTRSKTEGVLGTPHTGPAYFARAYNLPILPVGLVDTNKKKKECSAHIGQLIQPSFDLEATTSQIMHALSALTGYKLPER